MAKSFVSTLGLLLGLTACRSELLEPPDLSLADLAAGGPDMRVDMARPVDFAVPFDQAICTRHERTEIAVTSISTVGGMAVSGQAIRLALGYTLATGCETLADVPIEVSPGGATDFVKIVLHAWHSDEGCGPSQSATLVVVIPPEQLSSPTLAIQASGGLSVIFPVATNPVTSCASVPLGGACTLDCQCEGGSPGALCLTAFAMTSLCAYPCNHDSACMGQGGPYCEAGWICGPLPPNECRTVCPLGQHPEECVCRADAIQDSRVCSCDTECGTGRLCTDLGCVQPCTFDTDCPDAFGDIGVCSDGACTLTI